MKIIKEVTKQEFKEFLYHKLNIEDEKLYEEIKKPDTIGIFQFNGGTARRLVDEILPDNFEELNAVNAMSRPGPIELVPDYINGKNGQSNKYHPLVMEVLHETFGVPLYQEQILKIFQVIGGFSLEEADEVRGLMKKLGKLDKSDSDLKKWDKVTSKFKKGAVVNGLSESDVDTITKDLVSFAGYSFNKSHSTSYTYIAIINLYLAVYFKKYFYSSVLEYEADRDEYLVERLVTVKNYGFEILPPDINLSGKIMKPLDGNKIIFGLSDIKGVGETACGVILENKPYNDFFDFIIKTRSRQVTSAIVNKLLKIGAFDSIIGGERKRYIHAFNTFWEKKGSTKINEKLESIWKKCLTNSLNVPLVETTSNDLMDYEKEVMGFNFFTSPFTDKRVEVINLMKKRGIVYYSLEEVTMVSRKIAAVIGGIRTIKDRNGNEMAFLEIEDVNRNRASFPIFSSFWKVIGGKILSYQDKIVLINVYRADDNKIMFGQKGYVSDENRISRMIMEMP